MKNLNYKLAQVFFLSCICNMKIKGEQNNNKKQVSHRNLFCLVVFKKLDLISLSLSLSQELGTDSEKGFALNRGTGGKINLWRRSACGQRS